MHVTYCKSAQYVACDIPDILWMREFKLILQLRNQGNSHIAMAMFGALYRAI